MYKSKRKGVSMIEILITLSIMGIVTSISIGVLHSLSNTESLDKETELVLSYINRTRSNAINSLNFEEQGVQFSSSTVRIYYGIDPEANSTSTTYTLSSSNVIQNVNLSNNLSSFYFYKLSGEPSATGTLTIRNSDGQEKTIIIYGTGISDVQ